MAELKVISSDELSSAVGLARDAFERPQRESGETAGVTLSEINELRQLVEPWEGQAVIAHYDRPTASWFFIALHDATLGHAAGGCRMSTYETTADAVRDAMRLAEAMTRKWAVIDTDAGGGKSVLAVPHPLEGAERAGLLTRFGHLLEALGGIYGTGEDLGTTPDDMRLLAGVTRYAYGFDVNTGRLIEPGPYTARGVLAGTRTSLARVFGDGKMTGRTVLVQGVGHVGGPLARLLREEGATLILSDADEQRMLRLAEELECPWVASASVYETPCDVYAPCAMGGTLSHKTAPQLPCRIVAGAANNQLESASVADALHKRGILYAPDYVINAGGAIALPLLHGGASEEAARARVEAIAVTLGQIFDEAAGRGESPLHAAERKVERVLARARMKAAEMRAL